MSRVGNEAASPKAIIHKQILSAAEDQPDASLEELADTVGGGASLDMVDRVLERYGDPGMGEDADNPAMESEYSSTDPMHSSSTEKPRTSDSVSETNADIPDTVDIEALSEKQCLTVELLRRNPSASQSELADLLDVTAATVSRRLNEIEGFEWSNRDRFLEALPDEPIAEIPDLDSDVEQKNESAEESHGGVIEEEPPSDTTLASEKSPDLAALAAKVDSIEEHLSESSSHVDTLPPALLHKVLQAVIRSDSISEDEELEIIRYLIE